MLSGNKRSEERDEEATDIFKRVKYQFYVDEFLSETLGEYFESEDRNVQRFIDKVRCFCNIS